MAIPSGYSTGRCWQTGRTREQTVVLLLVAGRQLLGQVFVIFQVFGQVFVFSQQTEEQRAILIATDRLYAYIVCFCARAPLNASFLLTLCFLCMRSFIYNMCNNTNHTHNTLLCTSTRVISTISVGKNSVFCARVPQEKHLLLAIVTSYVHIQCGWYTYV